MHRHEGDGTGKSHGLALKAGAQQSGRCEEAPTACRRDGDHKFRVGQLSRMSAQQVKKGSSEHGS